MEHLNPHDQTLFAEHYLIETYGWMVQAVMGDDETLSFNYTVGLVDRFRHPELILVGLDSCCGGPVVNELAERVRDGIRLEPRTTLLTRTGFVLLGEVHPMHFLPPVEWFCTWAGYYEALGRDDLGPQALQIFVPDEAGYFPGDPLCDRQTAARQPLLSDPDATSERVVPWRPRAWN